MKKLNKKGFTLIEIIVVVVVLAVLMAVAVPSVLKYINEADNAKYMAQGRSVMTTAQAELVKAYIDDSKVTTAELDNLKNATTYDSGNNGMGVVVITNILVDTDVTISQAPDGTLTVTGGTELAATAADTTLTTVPNLKAVVCTIDGKKVVAVPNGKIYVGK